MKQFLLTGDKFMPEIHLRQPGFIYSACKPFTKKKKKRNNTKIKRPKTGDNTIYLSKLTRQSLFST